VDPSRADEVLARLKPEFAKAALVGEVKPAGPHALVVES
jgi:hypothetical protein